MEQSLNLVEMVQDSKIDYLIWIEDDFRDDKDSDNIYKNIVRSWSPIKDHLVEHRDTYFKPLNELITSYFEYSDFVENKCPEFENVHLATHQQRIELFGEHKAYENLYNIIEKYKDHDLLTYLAASVNIPPELSRIIQSFYDASKPVYIVNDTDNIEKYVQYIEDNKEALKNSRILFFIDKNMSGAYSGIEAYEIISAPIRQNDDFELIPIIYSSRIEGTSNLHHIFSKESSEMAQIMKYSLEPEFKNVLFYLKIADLFKHQIESIRHIMRKPFFNLSTINYMIKSANKEGETPIDHIIEWMEISTRKDTQQRQLEDRHILQKYINNISEDRVEVSFDRQLLEIGNDDIYDILINRKLTSIAPGDIFLINEKYYLLMGAPCDIALRSNGKRKKEILYLIEGELVNKIATKKINYFNSENDQIVELSNFICNGHSKVIRFTLNKTVAVDGMFLDTCSFNQEGEFIIPADNSNLSVGQQKRYNQIIEVMQSPVLLNHIRRYMITFDARYSSDGQYHDEARRITRIRPQYFTYINQLYNNIVGRVGFNTISMNPFEKVNVAIYDSNEKFVNHVDAILIRMYGQEDSKKLRIRISNREIGQAIGIAPKALIGNSTDCKLGAISNLYGKKFVLCNDNQVYLRIVGD